MESKTYLWQFQYNIKYIESSQFAHIFQCSMTRRSTELPPEMVNMGILTRNCIMTSDSLMRSGGNCNQRPLGCLDSLNMSKSQNNSQTGIPLEFPFYRQPYWPHLRKVGNSEQLCLGLYAVPCAKINEWPDIPPLFPVHWHPYCGHILLLVVTLFRDARAVCTYWTGQNPKITVARDPTEIPYSEAEA